MKQKKSSITRIASYAGRIVINAMPMHVSIAMMVTMWIQMDYANFASVTAPYV
jgi:hypothetical protein